MWQAQYQCPNLQAFTRTERERFSSKKLGQNDIIPHERSSLLEFELSGELNRMKKAQFIVQKNSKYFFQ